MRLKIDLDKTVSRLIPKFLRNPKNYQWIRALVSPIEYINDEFIVFAEDRIQFAKISSQTFLLEGFLTDRFRLSGDIANNENVEILHAQEEADSTYYGTETPPDNPPYLDGHMVVYDENETPDVGKESPFIFYDIEDYGALPEDFRVIIPNSMENNESATRELLGIVDRYKIDTKKYDVKYSE